MPKEVGTYPFESTLLPNNYKAGIELNIMIDDGDVVGDTYSIDPAVDSSSIEVLGYDVETGIVHCVVNAHLRLSSSSTPTQDPDGPITIRISDAQVWSVVP